MRRWLTGWRLVLMLLGLAAAVEGGAWAALSAWYAIRPSGNPLVAEYMKRPHPLLAHNDDLRAVGIGRKFDPFVGYRLLPNHLYTGVDPGFQSVIETDGAGFVHTGDRSRTPELLAAPRERSYRIVVLGSSAVYGAGASSNAKTLPARLEAKLRAKWPGVPFLVINAGVPAYQSTQERLYYELYLRDLDPDVLLDITGNADAGLSSLLESWRPHWNTAFPMTNDLYLDSFRPLPSIRRFFSALMQFPQPLYSLAVMRKLVGSEPSSGEAAHRDRLYFHAESARQFAANIEGIARIAEDDGTLVLFGLQPHLGSKRATLGGAEQKILEADKAFIDMVQRYQVDFEKALGELAMKYNGRRMAFVDFSGAFDDESGQTFIDMARTSDLGNDVLAGKILAGFAPALERDLAAKGWVKSGGNALE